MLDPIMQGVHDLNGVELQVNSEVVQGLGEKFKCLEESVDSGTLLGWAKQYDNRAIFRSPSPPPSELGHDLVDNSMEEEVKEEPPVEVEVTVEMEDVENVEVKKDEEEEKAGTEAQEPIWLPQGRLLHKKKCDELHGWLQSAGKWCHSTARISAANEFSAAFIRAQHLLKECSDHEKWLLKAVELWECVEHFVEVVLDLCWSRYIMCLGDHHENGERPEDWMSRLNELLESRSDVEARWFHKGCCENDTEELDAMVERKLQDNTLEVNGPEHQLAHLLHDRLRNHSEWRPPFLQAYPFLIYHRLVVPSAKSSKKGGNGAILKLKWVYGMNFALKMRHPDASSELFFKEEFEKLHRYRSPYIVGVVGYWEVDSWSSYNPLTHEILRCPFLLMESMDHDLRVLMDVYRESRFSELEAIYLMLPVAKALRFLHGKDVAHRDVKPQNIMCKNVVTRSVGVDTIVKLIDFGEAMENASKPPDDPSGRAATLVGTFGYMDPAMWKPKSDAMGYSPLMGDVFSFAMVFAELLTWRSAFGVRIAQAQLKAGKRPSLPNETSDYIRFIVESCWHVDHLRRPDFKAICSMLQHAKFLLSETNFAYDPEEFFSYEDAAGGNRCITDIR